MWKVTLRSSTEQPIEFLLKPGTNSIGRNSDNDIVLKDDLASRAHAILDYNSALDLVTILDLDSTNGTFINQERLTQPRNLLPNDAIRVGQSIMTLVNTSYQPPQSKAQRLDTHALTRNYLLEAVDKQSVLLYEVLQRLNMILDLDKCLIEVADLMKRAMGADVCAVILAENFNQLSDLGFPTSIAQMAIDQKAAIIVPNLLEDPNAKISHSSYLHNVRSVLCVPVMQEDQVIGLTYGYKTDPKFRPFDENDLQLAVAISYQAGLAIQRMNLVKEVEAEQRIRHLLERFLAPREADFVLDHYQKNGHLPEMSEHKVTILFADIVDSTALAGRIGTAAFSEFLGCFYQEMTAVVFKHGGLIKFWGDSVMAVFGVVDRKENHESSAILAGKEILERLKAINKTDPQLNISVGVGIDTGNVMDGYMGSHDRVEFTVIGGPVNIAYRLEALARPDRIIVGPSTYKAIQGMYNIKTLDPVSIKGSKDLVQVYEIR